jgi:hypothetical protein
VIRGNRSTFSISSSWAGCFQGKCILPGEVAKNCRSDSPSAASSILLLRAQAILSSAAVLCSVLLPLLLYASGAALGQQCGCGHHQPASQAHHSR